MHRLQAFYIELKFSTFIRSYFAVKFGINYYFECRPICRAYLQIFITNNVKFSRDICIRPTFSKYYCRSFLCIFPVGFHMFCQQNHLQLSLLQVQAIQGMRELRLPHKLV